MKITKEALKRLIKEELEHYNVNEGPKPLLGPDAGFGSEGGHSGTYKKRQAAGTLPEPVSEDELLRMVEDLLSHLRMFANRPITPEVTKKVEKVLQSILPVLKGLPGGLTGEPGIPGLPGDM
jgi:hypothetical protein